VSKVVVRDDSVEIDADGQDLSYVVGMAKALWEETREPARGPLGFSREDDAQDDPIVR
jgi:hypothetical protein